MSVSLSLFFLSCLSKFGGFCVYSFYYKSLSLSPTANESDDYAVNFVLFRFLIFNGVLQSGLLACQAISIKHLKKNSMYNHVQMRQKVACVYIGLVLNLISIVGLISISFRRYEQLHKTSVPHDMLILQTFLAWALFFSIVTFGVFTSSLPKQSTIIVDIEGNPMPFPSRTPSKESLPIYNECSPLAINFVTPRAENDHQNQPQSSATSATTTVATAAIRSPL